MAAKQDQPSKQEWGRTHPEHLEGKGDAPMSDEQAHRLKALCWQRGERYDDSLTAAEAERRIAELTARG